VVVRGIGIAVGKIDEPDPRVAEMTHQVGSVVGTTVSNDEQLQAIVCLGEY
jgi:hypothetical protein